MTDTDLFWLRAIATRLEQSGDAVEAAKNLRWLIDTDAATRMDVPEMQRAQEPPYLIGDAP